MMNTGTPSGPSCHEHLLSGEAVRQRLASLADNQILKLLYTEHVVILKTLDRLEEEARLVRRNGAKPPDAEQLARFGTIALALLDAEPHHQREETVLFPELEGRGVYGPPHVMRAEHVELRQLKHELQDLATGKKSTPNDRIAAVAESIVANLRMHIHKENEILYPMAYDVIKQPADWDRLTAASDRVGPCAFMPQKS